MKIHIALVSAQILANLIPILMERPDRVLLMVTPEMAARRLERRLEKLLKEKGIGVKLCLDAPDSGLREIKAYADTLADQLIEEQADADIVLNATGGTKLMSFGFVEAFRGIASHILYTDTAHRRIEYLPNAQASLPEPTPMGNVLDVPLYLAAQGFRFRRAASDEDSWREAVSQRKATCKFFGKHIADPYLQNFVGAMNRLVDRALDNIPGTYEDRLVAPDQAFETVPFGIWAQALGELVNAGLITWQDGSPEVTFASVEAARFVRGGWLEEYAWHTVKDAGAFDTRLGVEGVWADTRKTINEFDVLACHINQLLFIECKTPRISSTNENEIVYKIDSLSQDARGLFGATWLLSARKPTDVLIERSRQAGVRLIGPDELAHLREWVLEWLAGRG
ncbi:Card1-like endonuclease domain-containing protein [Thiocapsa imhoffii]|nr:DUF1887 family CARF protein [Thiocapsa imhoffii]